MATLFGSMQSKVSESGVLRALKQIEHNRTPVRLEVENTNVSFYTVFTLQPGAIILNKPTDLNPKLIRRGRMLRFEVPDGSRNVVRLRVRRPHLKRKRGDEVFVCAMPKEYAEKSRRKTARFNTSQFKNLHLVIPQAAATFRIIDISLTGCRTFVGDFKEWDLIRTGLEMRFTKIAVGEKVEIALDGLVPRLIKAPTASFQWKVLKNSYSGRYLEHFIKTMHEKELSRLDIPEKLEPLE